MRTATAEDRAKIAQHVLNNYLALVENDPFEWLHQIKSAPSSFPHLFDPKLFLDGIHLICEDKGQIIATAGLVKSLDENNLPIWKLVSVYVDKSKRGNGIGETLVREIIKYAKTNNINHIMLFTLPLHMPEAGNLYRKLGFVFTKEIPVSKIVGIERRMQYHVYEIQL